MIKKDRLNPIGLGMNVMTRFASSDIPDRLGVRKESEQALEFISREFVKAMQGGLPQLPFMPKKPAKEKIVSNQSAVAGETGHLLDFNYNETQNMIAEMLEDFALNVIRPAASAANEKVAMPEDVMQAANELGLTSFLVPESLGGTATSRSPVTSRVIIEKLAKGDMGIALGLLSTMSFANALAQWGTPSQQDTYLKAFLSENSPTATIAINEPSIQFDINRPHCTAKKIRGGWQISGAKCFVPMAKKAKWILVAATDKSNVTRMFIVDSGSLGLSIKSKEAMGLKAAELCDIKLKNVVVSDSDVLGADDFDYGQFVNGVKTAWSAMAVGCSEAVLDFVIPYCNEREAFGEPISFRQAVAFMVANIGIELEGMRVLTDKAISDLEHKKNATRSAFLAYHLCSSRAMEIGSNGVQLLGGHGFTKEYPVERWYRDLRAAAILANGLYV